MTRETHYIDGEWVAGSTGEFIDVVDPTREQVFGRIPDGGPEDVAKAVRAARSTFPSWSRTPVADRVEYLLAISSKLAERAEEIARLLVSEIGVPITDARNIHAALPPLSFSIAADVLKNYQFETRLDSSIVIKEPIGVVAAITPWNFPIHQNSSKVAPALAAGCTVVLKPSEIAPLTSYILAEVIDSVGLPPGVFNLVHGTGLGAGEPLVGSPDVDMVTFTGSTRAGRRIGSLAADNVKRVALELGGKSANIICRDADMVAAVTSGVAACYANSGQACNALTRMLVPEERLAEVEQIAKQAALSYKVGDPFDEGVQCGPLVSAAQLQRVLDYIDIGISEGADLLAGGAERPEGVSTGFYVRPTVFSKVAPNMRIAREEIFGPVLCILSYTTEEEAIAVANDSIYGLGGGVWASDIEHAHNVARQLRTGQIEINGGNFNFRAPFGGYRQSGNGREWGVYGFEDFLETKALV